MLSISHLLCDQYSGSEKLRYGHTHRARQPGSAMARVPRPVVVWALTRACNLRCVHCYASATPHASPDELTHDQGIALLDDLAAFGIPAILFSGGEPLMRPDALEFIAHAQSLGLACTLSTNGMLIDQAMADKLAALKLKYVGISIDGTPAMHDKLRGQQGAFELAMRGIECCRKAGIKVGVRFTVHALNQHALESVFDLCHEHGVDRLCVYHLAYSGRGGQMQKVDLTAQQTRDVINRIMAATRFSHDAGYPLEVLTVGNHTDAAYLLMLLEQSDPKRAGQVRQLLEGTGGNRSGCGIASIDPTGDVHYDQFSWHYKCGNVKESSFSDIWSKLDDPRLAILRNRQSHLPDQCQHCRYLELCNGNLRTRAEAATGDWMGMDPSCYLNEAETMLATT